MAKAYVGAIVRYCGHIGTFIADIHKIGTVNVVRPNKPVTIKNLDRDSVRYAAATHQLKDFPVAGFWRPDLGVFVVPAKQVTKLHG